MPCKIIIRENLEYEITKLASPLMNRSYADAKRLAEEINQTYKYPVLNFYRTPFEALGYEVDVPSEMVDEYYEKELLIEQEEEARQIQAEDAERAGEEYDDDYLFTRKIDESILDQVTKDVAKIGLIDYNAIQAERDREIATKLGEKFKKAFGIDHYTVSEEDAYELLKDTPTPYQGEPAFYLNNIVYFVEGNFTSESVFHEYSHPFIKAIALDNPTLFKKLYLQAVGNTIGENIRAELIKENQDKPVGKRLVPESERFMEEVIVRAMTASAQNKLTGIKENDNLFKAFINNLLFAIKQIIRKLVGKKDLKGLSVDTTIDQLVDMMLGEDFIVDTSMLSKSNIAEFSNKTKTEIDSLLDELKSADAEDFINTINNVYSGITYQLNQLQSTPYRLKQLLKKKEGENAIDGEKVLRNIRSYLYSSQTVTKDISDVDPEELLQAIKNQEKDFNIRAIQLIKSIGETQVFARKIQSIVKNIKTEKQHLKEDGVDILDFYINFLVEQKRFLEETLSTLNLDEDTKFNKNVLSILNVVNNTLTEAGKLRFEAMAKWISNNSDFINQAIVDKFNAKLFLILSPQGFSEQEINAFSEDITAKVKAGKLRKFDVSDIELPKAFTDGALIVKEIEKLSKKFISEDSAARMLRGEAGDIGSIAANINTYSNINDPVGIFFREMKIEKSKAAAKSHEEEIEMIKALIPHLNAVGYNPNNTSMLADLIMFADKVGYVDNKTGEFKTMEVYSVLDKFKNWRADKAELEYNLDVARESKDKDAIRKALQDLWMFHENYMHRKYKQEVYDVQKIWNQENSVLDPITKTQITVTADESSMAYIERQMALDEMNTFSTSEFSTLDDLYEVTESSVAKRKYDQLFELYDVNGEAKPLEERKKVLVRLMYRKESAKFYNFKTNYDRVQKDFDNFITAELAAENITSDQTELYNKAIEKFKEKNFRIAYTPEYFEEYRRIMTRIGEITAKAKKNDVSLKLAELYKQRGVLVSIVTDKNGQPNGIHLKPEQIKKLKQIELDITELKEKFDRQTGLSKEDMDKISRYEYRIKLGTNPLSEAEMAEYKRLFAVKSEFQLSKSEANELRQKFTELSELTDILPTDYYLDAFNEMLGDATAILEEKGLLDPNDFPEKKVQEISVENADAWINSAIIKKAMAVNPEFAEWFNKNHYQVKGYDAATNSYVDKNMRLNVWSIKKPTNDDYYVKTTLIDPVTKNEITILGAPVSKYTYRSIKKEYLTGYNPLTDKVELEVGKYVDNKNEWLPREFGNTPDSALDNKYMNEEYASLDKKSARGQLIAEYKKQFLKLQESRPRASRLYLDMPREGIKANLEYIQSGKAKEAAGGRIKSIKGGLKSAFKRREDDYEKYNFNFDTDAQLVTTDIAGNEISRIPIFGTTRLQLADVSQDVLGVTSKYLYSLNEQQALIKNEPLAKALLRILEDPQNAIKNTSKASKDIKKKRNYNRFLNAKGENERLKLVEAYIDRVFYGQNVSSFQENNPVTTKVVKMLMGAASRSFIALDVQSALKNTYGMTFQKMIEVAGGQYMSYRAAAEGRMTAYKATVELSAKGIYQLGPKSLLLQMMELFDPVTGKTKKDFGKSTSRTFIKDMLDGTFLYDGRKLLELNASLQLFFGMMHHKTIEQTIDGKTNKIKYFEAFELGDNDIITLKPGIDPEWNFKPITHVYAAGETLDEIAKKYSTTVDRIKELNLSDTFEPGDSIKISDAKLFNDFKLKIQGTGKRLNGQIAEEDNPRASKYLLYNLATFYRKFALPMFLNRFQADMSKENRWGEVYDFDMGTTTRGYYITAIDATIRMIKDFKKTYPKLTDEEKSAIKKVLAEGLMLFALYMVATFLFGYDPGDEDRFEKLKAKEERFGQLGWMSNEMLYLTIMVQRENQMFVPVPGIGIDEWLDLTESTSIATSPTLELYSKIFMDLFYLASGNDKAYYKQDVGPYFWQEQGDTKLGNHIASIFGLKGKNVSPIWAIKKAEAFENLK